MPKSKEETKEEVKSFDFKETMLAVKDDLIKSIKEPVTLIEKNVKKNDMNKTYTIGVLYIISFAILFVGLFKVAFEGIMGLAALMQGGLGSALGSSLLKSIKIPYIRIFIYGLGISLVMLLAYAVVMLIVPAIFKNKKLDFKKSLTFTTSAYIPMIVVNLVCGIFGMLGLSFKFLFIVYLIANTIVSYNFAYAYGKETNVEDNKFGYVIALLVILSGFISGLNIYLTSETFTKSIVTDISKNTDLNDLDDLDDWD